MKRGLDVALWIWLSVFVIDFILCIIWLSFSSVVISLMPLSFSFYFVTLSCRVLVLVLVIISKNTLP